MLRLLPILLLCCIAALLLAGCGGSAPSAPHGAAILTINWPAASSRLIPDAATGIEVKIADPNDPLLPILSRWIPRPAAGGSSIVSFPVLPVGLLQITAQAIAAPSANDWDRYVLASGTAPLIIVAGQVTNSTLTMNSNIDSISVSASIMRLVIGNASSVTVTALDAQNNPLLMTPSRIVWETSAPGTINVSPDPLTPFTYVVSAVAAGSVTLWARDTESNKISASITVVTAATPILPTTADVIGSWRFSDESSLVVTQTGTAYTFDLYPITYDFGYEITPDATHAAGLVNGAVTGTFNSYDLSGAVVGTGTATLTCTWDADNTLKVEAVGTATTGSFINATYTGGVKQ